MGEINFMALGNSEAAGNGMAPGASWKAVIEELHRQADLDDHSNTFIGPLL